MQTWAKIAIIVLSIGGAIYFKSKAHDAMHSGKPIPPNPDVIFANKVRLAYNNALLTGRDEELERLYDIWKKEHYTPEELAKPGESGAREVFKAQFGLI